jgi:hypothetical protein
MGDPIKTKLKEDRKARIQQGIEENLPGQNCMPVRKPAQQKGVLQSMYNVGNPVQKYGESPRLIELEKSVRKINEGQTQLERIRRMENSPVYKGWVGFVDSVKSLVGITPTKTNIHELFRTQQENVRDLNYILVSMGGAYECDIKMTRGTLDNLVDKVKDETIRRKGLDKEISPEIQRYEDAVAKLNEIDREQNPEAYYAAFKEVINSKRVSRKKRFEYTVTAMGQEHHKDQVDNLMLQEELFETMLYRVMEMAYSTELYQQTLDQNERIWVNIQELSHAVSRVSGGVAVLADFNRQLNQSYINAVREISQIVDSHPGGTMLASTNRDLRLLVSDVNASAYRNAAQYDRVLPEPQEQENPEQKQSPEPKQDPAPATKVN